MSITLAGLHNATRVAAWLVVPVALVAAGLPGDLAAWHQSSRALFGAGGYDDGVDGARHNGSQDVTTEQPSTRRADESLIVAGLTAGLSCREPGSGLASLVVVRETSSGTVSVEPFTDELYSAAAQGIYETLQVCEPIA